MDRILYEFFRRAAWMMNTPRPYSAFHLLFGTAGILTAVILARRMARRPYSHVLFISGLLLAASELFKQGFLYYIVNNRSYDWWYFPFQLCSVPMYLGLLYPASKKLKSKAVSKSLETFIQDFALLGGVMALAEPSGLMQPYWVLTLHGFVWHFMLIFMGLYCAVSRTGGRKTKDFLYTLPLFFLCALIATFINVTSHPYGNADMFYISPYYPNGQIVFHEIAVTIGTLPGNLLYLAAVILGGFICHMIPERIQSPFLTLFKKNR